MGAATDSRVGARSCGRTLSDHGRLGGCMARARHMICFLSLPRSGATRRFRCWPSRGRWLRRIEVILANSRRWDDSLDVAGQVGGDYRRRLIARLPQRLSIDRTRQTETVQIEEAVSPRNVVAVLCSRTCMYPRSVLMLVRRSRRCAVFRTFRWTVLQHVCQSRARAGEKEQSFQIYERAAREGMRWGT